MVKSDKNAKEIRRPAAAEGSSGALDVLCNSGLQIDIYLLTYLLSNLCRCSSRKYLTTTFSESKTSSIFVTVT